MRRQENTYHGLIFGGGTEWRAVCTCYDGTSHDAGFHTEGGAWNSPPPPPRNLENLYSVFVHM